MSTPLLCSAASLDADEIARELKIPPCPAILAQFTAEAKKDDPDPQLLAALIGKDAGLAGAIIKAVNSPVYGLARKAADIPQALAILGLRAAANLITALLLRQAFPASSGALMQRFWDESTRIAETAGTVARHVRGVGREEALTYGLFRNCGIAVMIAKFPYYGGIADAHSRTPGPDLAIAEEAKYRFNHARVGYALARGWNLPDALCRSIQHHHDFARVASGTRDTQGASAALIAAGLLAEQVAALRAGGSVTPEWETHEAAVLKILAIDADAIVAMVAGYD